VCERRVDLLVCSLPLHRHSYIGFILSFASSFHNKQLGASDLVTEVGQSVSSVTVGLTQVVGSSVRRLRPQGSPRLQPTQKKGENPSQTSGNRGRRGRQSRMCLTHRTSGHRQDQTLRRTVLPQVTDVFFLMTSTTTRGG
jgi:hypothetical protein